jgi:hypothetical protein
MYEEANLANATVPEATLEPFRFVRDAPEPENVVAVITPPAKFPDASRMTSVDAPLAEAAFVENAIVSVEESPVMLNPPAAVYVRVSVEESATGLVPDGVEMVANEFEAEPPPTRLVVTPAPPPVISM